MTKKIFKYYTNALYYRCFVLATTEASVCLSHPAAPWKLCNLHNLHFCEGFFS